MLIRLAYYRIFYVFFKLKMSYGMRISDWSADVCSSDLILEWGRAQFGITLNEGFGQTECNIVLAHAPLLMAARFGSLGKAAPGHVGAIVDDVGREAIGSGSCRERVGMYE